MFVSTLIFMPHVHIKCNHYILAFFIPIYLPFSRASKILLSLNRLLWAIKKPNKKLTFNKERTRVFFFFLLWMKLWIYFAQFDSKHKIVVWNGCGHSHFVFCLLNGILKKKWQKFFNDEMMYSCCFEIDEWSKESCPGSVEWFSK